MAAICVIDYEFGTGENYIFRVCMEQRMEVW
jgi:hypothetical protein